MNHNDVTDPNALILWRLDEADKRTETHRIETRATLGRIFDQVKLTNGRLTSLETSRTFIKGVLWAFAVVLGGIGSMVTWYVTYHGGHP